MWLKPVGWLFVGLGLLLLASLPRWLPAQESYVISKSEVIELLNSISQVKQELQGSKLSLLEAQKKLDDLMVSYEALQKRLDLSVAESTLLLTELKELKKSFDEYKLAVRLKLHQLNVEKWLFGAAGVVIGGLVTYGIVKLVEGAAK